MTTQTKETNHSLYVNSKDSEIVGNTLQIFLKDALSYVKSIELTSVSLPKQILPIKCYMTDFDLPSKDMPLIHLPLEDLIDYKGEYRVPPILKTALMYLKKLGALDDLFDEGENGRKIKVTVTNLRYTTNAQILGFESSVEAEDTLLKEFALLVKNDSTGQNSSTETRVGVTELLEKRKQTKRIPFLSLFYNYWEWLENTLKDVDLVIRIIDEEIKNSSMNSVTTGSMVNIPFRPFCNRNYMENIDGLLTTSNGYWKKTYNPLKGKLDRLILQFYDNNGLSIDLKQTLKIGEKNLFMIFKLILIELEDPTLSCYPTYDISDLSNRRCWGGTPQAGLSAPMDRTYYLEN